MGGRKMPAFIVICIVLALSATFEAIDRGTFTARQAHRPDGF